MYNYLFFVLYEIKLFKIFLGSKINYILSHCLGVDMLLLTNMRNVLFCGHYFSILLVIFLLRLGSGPNPSHRYEFWPTLSEVRGHY